MDKAQHVIDSLKNEYDFVQIGGPEDLSLSGCINMHTEKLPMRKTAAILANSDLYVGPIGGLMMLAESVGCPGVIAYSAEPPEFVALSGNINVTSDHPCDLCMMNRIHPARHKCPYDYKCMTGIDADKIVMAIRNRLSQPRNLPPQIEPSRRALEYAGGIYDLIQFCKNPVSTKKFKEIKR